MRSDLTCEHCGAVFWRKRSKRDARRFCSKRCGGLWKAAHGQLAYRQPHLVAAREVGRAIATEQKEARRALALGRRQVFKVRRAIRRSRKCAHLCPDCGSFFVAPESRVFCSRICQKRYKPDRYPSIQTCETAGDRNALAALIALVREIRRRLNDTGISEHG